MPIKQRLRKPLSLSFCLILALGGGGNFYTPSAISASVQPNLHGITIGTIDLNKELTPQDSIDEIKVEGIFGKLGATVADIQVDGQTNSRGSLSFSDLDQTADRGWYFVDPTEALSWINAFGGNPAYILGGAANVYSKQVTNITKGTSHTAYNLAELATASGGKGETHGDNLVQQPDGTYKSVGHFKTSPRPSGSIQTDKPAYNVNELVHIQATAQDNSFYDKGIIVHSLAVINRTTGGGYQQFHSNQSYSGATWNSGSLSYTPSEPGEYEAILVITDLHHRTTADSPSISIAKPIISRFTVGSVTAPSCDLSTTTTRATQNGISMPSGGSHTLSTGVSTITLTFPKPGKLKINGVSYASGTTFADIPINASKTIYYESDDKTDCWTKEILPPPVSTVCTPVPWKMEIVAMGDTDSNPALSTGEPSFELKRHVDTLQFTPPLGERGIFYINGTAAQTTPTSYYEISVSSGSDVHVRFQTESGQCWEKLFTWERIPVDNCPDVWLDAVGNSKITTGERLTATLNGTLDLHATYADLMNHRAPAEVIWKIKKPDGTVYTMNMEERERETASGPRVGWYPVKTTHLHLPSPDWYRPEHVMDFDQYGEYQITIDYTSDLMWAGRCAWSAIVEVVDPATADICEKTALTATVNGIPAPLTGQAMTLFTGTSPTVTWAAQSEGSSVGVSADWTLRKAGSTAIIRTGVGQNPFSHTFIDTTDTTYTLEGVIHTKGVTCRQTISIHVQAPVPLEEPTCPELYLHFTNVDTGEIYSSTNGNTKQIKADRVDEWRLVLTNDPWQASPSATVVQIEANWSGALTNQHSPPQSAFLARHTLPGSYTITASVNDPRYPSLACTLSFTLVIEEEADCSGIYLHLFDTVTGDFTYNAAGQTIVIKEDAVDALGVMLSPSAGAWAGSVVRAEWTGTLPNLEGSPATTYRVENLTPGTYTITATIKDIDYPMADGCKFTVTVIVGKDATPPPPPCTTCNPGGSRQGGKLTITLFDTDSRQLTSNTDGVWEREAVRILVQLEQTRLAATFAEIDNEVNQAITAKIDELQATYPAPRYQNVVVTAAPPNWSSATNPLTEWPASFPLNVQGPGINQSFSLNPKLTAQSVLYTGTSVPTQTTWRQVLNSTPYKVSASDFSIPLTYLVTFTVAYQQCDSGGTCTNGTATETIGNAYTIAIQGNAAAFQVFEPNVRGFLAHTAEWTAYHQRDRYLASQPNDFYAGERILVRLTFDARHRHPVSGKYPTISSATAWMSETGQRATPLQSSLPLTAASSTLWKGPEQLVPKLGLREKGVDIPLMGDKQKGFKKGTTYNVRFQVEFGYGVKKGFLYPNASTLYGHNIGDYRSLIRIIANAWERQGIRNHSTH